MPIRYTRNAWFFGLPCFGLGYLLAGVNFHKRAWYKYIYLPLGVLFYFLQISEFRLLKTDNISLEMYTTGVISAVFLLLFFLGIKKSDCPFFYRYVGKNAPFYIYILHLAVMVVQQMLFPIGIPLHRALVVFFSSFILYEVVFLLSKVWRKKGETSNILSAFSILLPLRGGFASLFSKEEIFSENKKTKNACILRFFFYSSSR